MSKMSYAAKSMLLILPVVLWVTLGFTLKSKEIENLPNVDVASPLKTVQLILMAGTTPVMNNVASIFTQRVQERIPAKISTSGGAELKIELVINSCIAAEGFTIANGEDGSIRIIGNDQRSLLYGVGKFLWHSKRSLYKRVSRTDEDLPHFSKNRSGSETPNSRNREIRMIESNFLRRYEAG